MAITQFSLILVTFFVLFQGVYTTACSNSDYQTIVGGTDFEVESMSTAIKQNGDILVGGFMNKELTDVFQDTNRSFLYLLEKSTCTISWSYEYESFDRAQAPAVAWSYDEQYAYMLTYNDYDAGSEYLVVIQDPSLSYSASSDAPGKPEVWKTSITEEGTTYVLGRDTLFGHPSRNYQVIIVTPTDLRKAQVAPANQHWVQHTDLADSENMHAVMKGEYLYLLTDADETLQTTKIGFVSDLNRDVTEVYSFQIELSQGQEYDYQLGGRIDVHTESTTDSWFVCASQMYEEEVKGSSIPSPGADYTELYNLQYDDGEYSNSVRHQYQKYSQCLATFATNQNEAVFVIFETDASYDKYTNAVTHVKFLTINYSTGVYSVKTSASTNWQFSPSSYHPVDAHALVDSSDGSFFDFYIYGVAFGLDNSSQQLSHSIGFVTTSEDGVSRDSSFSDQLPNSNPNTFEFNDQSTALSSGTLDCTLSSGSCHAPGGGGSGTPSHTYSKLDTSTIAVKKTGIRPESENGNTYELKLPSTEQKVGAFDADQTDCPVDQQVVLNYAPTYDDLGLSFPMKTGTPLYIGILGSGYDSGDIMPAVAMWFNDIDENYPISVVIDSFKVDPFFPADYLQWQASQEILYFRDFNSTVDAITEYLDDNTPIGGTTWSRFKKEAMKYDFRNTQAYEGLSNTDKHLLYNLYSAQVEQGNMQALDYVSGNSYRVHLTIEDSQGVQSDITINFYLTQTVIISYSEIQGLLNELENENEEEETESKDDSEADVEAGEDNSEEGGGGCGGDEGNNQRGGQGNDQGGGQGNNQGGGGQGQERRMQGCEDGRDGEYDEHDEEEKGEFEDDYNDYDDDHDDDHEEYDENDEENSENECSDMMDDVDEYSECAIEFCQENYGEQKYKECMRSFGLFAGVDTDKYDLSQITPLILSIDNISSLGVLRIALSRPIEPEDEDHFDRQLQSDDEIEEFVKERLDCQIWVISAQTDTDEEDSASRDVNLTWDIIQIIELSIDIQIHFNDPLHISAGTKRDTLQVIINFAGIDVTVDDKQIIQKKIPKQMELGGSAEALQQTAQAAQHLTTAATLGTTISQILMAGSLSQLWGMINGMQIFVHLPLFEVSMPASARMLVDKMIFFVTFDIIESEQVFGTVLDFPEEENGSISGKFDESGYQSAYMINLMGVGFIFITVVLAFMFILLLTYPLAQMYERVKRVHTQISDAIFWGVWIRFLMEESLVCFISTFCNVFNSNECQGSECEIEPAAQTNDTSIDADFKTAPEDGEIQVSLAFLIVNNTTVVLLGSVLVLMPIFIAIFYPYNYNHITEGDFEKKYGEVYTGMHDNKKSTLFYPFFFMVRRYLFVFTICIPQFMHLPWLQIFTCLILAMVSILYLIHTQPFKETIVTNLEIFNEVTTLVLLYHVLCFTNFCPDVRTQVLVGYSFVFFLSANMATHIFFLLRSTFLDYKRKSNLKKQQKEIAKREEEAKEKALTESPEQVAVQRFRKHRKRVIMNDPAANVQGNSLSNIEEESKEYQGNKLYQDSEPSWRNEESPDSDKQSEQNWGPPQSINNTMLGINDSMVYSMENLHDQNAQRKDQWNESIDIPKPILAPELQLRVLDDLPYLDRARKNSNDLFGQENKQQEDDIFLKSSGDNKSVGRKKCYPKNGGKDGVLELSMQTLDLHVEPAFGADDNPQNTSRSKDQNKQSCAVASEGRVIIVSQEIDEIEKQLAISAEKSETSNLLEQIERQYNLDPELLESEKSDKGRNDLMDSIDQYFPLQEGEK